MPQRPSTTLGMAASSSTIMPTGVRSTRGASSLRNRPIAIAIGTAITSATTDVNSVPMMKLRAPNWPVTTFHWSLVRKPSPNSWMLGQRQVVHLVDQQHHDRDQQQERWPRSMTRRPVSPNRGRPRVGRGMLEGSRFGGHHVQRDA